MESITRIIKNDESRRVTVKEIIILDWQLLGYVYDVYEDDCLKITKRKRKLN